MAQLDYLLQNKMMADLQKRNAQIDWDYFCPIASIVLYDNTTSVFPNDGSHLCSMLAPFLYVLKRTSAVFNILGALFYSAIDFSLVNGTQVEEIWSQPS